MTTTTVFGDATDGYIRSVNATYATAAAGSGTFTVTNNTELVVGQSTSGGNTLQISYLAFDTSGIPDGDEISAVELNLFGKQDSSVTNFDLVAKAYDWSAGGVTTADWLTPTQLALLTTLASVNTSTYAAAYMPFTSAGVDFNAYINKTGITYFIVVSSRTISATPPSGDEQVFFHSSNVTGTTNDPKLVITHASVTSPTLHTSAGTFTLTGAAATLLNQSVKILAAGAGSFLLTGTAAVLRKFGDPLWSNSVQSTDFDFIQENDPNSFENVVYLGVSSQDMPGGSRNVFRYRASFRDSTHTVDFYMDATGGSSGGPPATDFYVAYPNEAAARVDVDKYCPRLGKLPKIYRDNIHHVDGFAGNGVDDSTENASSEDAGHFFILHVDRSNTRISEHDLEETFFHEGSHASVQKAGTGAATGLGVQDYLNSSEWAAAVAADGRYITTYAASANQEDFAESALFAYTLLLHPERLEPYTAAIRAQIPNRIAFFQNIVFAGAQIACARVPAANVKLPTRFTNSLVNNTSLNSHCRDVANLKVEAFYSHGSLAAAGKPDLYKFTCTVCGRVHPRFSAGNEPRPFWEVR